MTRLGDFAALSLLAEEKREQAEYQAELLSIIEHCTAATTRMRQGALLLGNRAHLWAHLCDAIALAERELEKGN